MGILFNIFSKKDKSKIRIGQIWVLRKDDDKPPWEQKNRIKMLITDYVPGWVQYRVIDYDSAVLHTETEAYLRYDCRLESEAEIETVQEQE